MMLSLVLLWRSLAWPCVVHSTSLPHNIEPSKGTVFPWKCTASSPAECVRLVLQVQRQESQPRRRWICGRTENGHANPTLNALEVIANALGLTVFELFERVRATDEVSGVMSEA